ncbi:hypothetical protein TNCV_1694361 [Trichonephila clavipes]|nr:hypothetical protein TNCV_1694361 [Trichonephila clavipes]
MSPRQIEIIKSEVNKMLELKIIEPGKSDFFTSPLILVEAQGKEARAVSITVKKSFKTTGMCSRRHGEVVLGSTTPAEDRYIVLSAKKRNRRTTAQQVANQFLAASESRSPENCCQTFEGEEDYTHADLLCVSH